jgi:uncharacterized protein (DUF305 family)
MLRILAPPTALVATLALASCGTSSSPGAGAPAASGTTTSAPVAGPPVPASPTPTATGTPSPVGPPASGPSNVDDVGFAMSMITSHLQAKVIAALAPKHAEHAKDDKIKALAPNVTKAQGPEVTTMAGWLVGGGIPVPDATGGHDMSAMGGPKMQVVISPQEMTALGKATGAGFDRMWLQLMLKSHEAAVAMARTELTKGVNPDAKKLAQSIFERQSGEVATMKSILTGISG